MKKYNIWEKIKIWSERKPFSSWCSHCGRTWDRVDYKIISYGRKLPEDSGSGMFPICVGCFDELSSDEIFEYCTELLDRWKKGGFDRNIDLDILKYNVDYMKKKEI